MLNLNQERFIREYLKNEGDAQAAYRAAYDCTGRTMESVSASASRLLKHPEIRDRASAVLRKAEKKTEATVERIMAEYARMGFSDIRKAVKWGHKIEVDDATGAKAVTSGVVLLNSDEIDDDTAAAIAEVSEGPSGLKVKFHDKKGALDALAKIRGMFIERQEVTHIDPAAAERAAHVEQMLFQMLSGMARPVVIDQEPRHLNGNGAVKEPKEWPK